MPYDKIDKKSQKSLKSTENGELAPHNAPPRGKRHTAALLAVAGILLLGVAAIIIGFLVGGKSNTDDTINVDNQQKIQVSFRLTLRREFLSSYKQDDSVATTELQNEVCDKLIRAYRRESVEAKKCAIQNLRMGNTRYGNRMNHVTMDVILSVLMTSHNDDIITPCSLISSMSASTFVNSTCAEGVFPSTPVGPNTTLVSTTTARRTHGPRVTSLPSTTGPPSTLTSTNKPVYTTSTLVSTTKDRTRLSPSTTGPLPPSSTEEVEVEEGCDNLSSYMCGMGDCGVM